MGISYKSMLVSRAAGTYLGTTSSLDAFQWDFVFSLKYVTRLTYSSCLEPELTGMIQSRDAMNKDERRRDNEVHDALLKKQAKARARRKEKEHLVPAHVSEAQTLCKISRSVE